MSAVYVVAGSTQEYERWLRGPGTAYVPESIHLLGNVRQINIMQKTDTIVLLSDWQRRSDWRAIYNAMLATGKTGVRL